MKKQMFYRCLNIPGTKERWINKQYTSTHSSPPDDWYSKWKLTGSKDPNDYPLKCDFTYYYGMEYYYYSQNKLLNTSYTVKGSIRLLRYGTQVI